MKTILAGLSLGLGLFCASATPAATYSGIETAANGATILTATYSLTTDKIGTITAADIIDFAVDITQDGMLSFSFTNLSLGASATIGPDAPLVADGTALTYDFSTLANSGRVSLSATNPSGFIGGLVFNGGVLAISTGDGYAANLYPTRPQVIATVSGVPEPATWAMLAAGFGMIGAGLRKRAVMPTTNRP